MSIRPRLHIRPEKGWLNDPNGLCLIDGRYHVYFQYNPDQPVHDTIRWGHASSDDLLHWVYEPVAFLPRAGEADSGGCWSGCMTIDDAGIPTAVYTGIRGSSREAEVVVARSHDGLRTFTYNVRTAVGMPDDPAISDVRDPFIFSFEGRRYAIQGAGHNPGGPARILLYDACDLDHWTLLGDLLTDADPVAAQVAPADIWECPNLFQLGDQWVLIVSLWRSVDGEHHLAGVRHLIGQLRSDDGMLTFHPIRGGTVDTGPAFYAPQVLVDEDRVLLWGWAWELDRGAAQVQEAGWAGVLTFPRELGLTSDGQLSSRPARELQTLRHAPAPLAEVLTHSAFELEGADLQVFLGDLPVAELRGPGRIMVDASIVEVFPEHGTPFTTRAYAESSGHWRVEGEVRQVWPLRLPGSVPD